MRTVALLGLVFVAPLQLLAAVFAVLARDAGGATTLATLGLSWAAIGAVSLTGSPQTTDPALGLFLVCLAVVVLALAGAAAAERPVLGVLLLLASVRFVLNGLYELLGDGWLERASGWVGVPIVGAALYVGLALLIEDARKETVLPLGRRGAAQGALQHGLDQQVRGIEREAGVRARL